MGDPDAISSLNINLVLVHEEKPRGFWKVARVMSVITGKDGKVSEAMVRASNPSVRQTNRKRPVNLFYPLEIKAVIQTQPQRCPKLLLSQMDSITEIPRRQAGSMSKKERVTGTKSVIWIDD